MKHKPVFLTIIIFLRIYSTAHAGDFLDASIDKELQSLWSSMINGLQAGDIEGALGYFTEGSRRKYKETFMSVKDRLPEVFRQMEKIEAVYIRDNEAKYRIRITKGEDEYTHYIWFRKDIFGRWKIDKF